MSVVVRDETTLLHAMAHHAKALEPLVGAFSLQFLLRLEPLGWRIRQSGVGAQSYSISRGTGSTTSAAGATPAARTRS